MLKRLQYLSGTIEKRLYTMGVLSSRGLHLPDFIGIGAQKAGTTWLCENLRQHPQLYLPAQKELHYFDWNFHRPVRWYAAHFRSASDRTKGEITPGYSILSRDRIAFVHRLMPDLRLILLLRNPIERAWSQALMNLAALAGRKCGDVSEEEFREHFRSARSVERGDYLATIENWLGVYPSEQLYIGFYEDIADHPRELLGAVFRHLGVSADVDWNAFPYDRVIFKGDSTPLPDRLRSVLVEMYRDDLRRLAERFGERVSRWQVA